MPPIERGVDMRDQADRLRALVTGADTKQLARPVSRDTRVISITSGKGGVGKTTLAVNLAIAAQMSGLETVIFDADLGLANVDIALGLFPRYNLMHVLQGEKSIKEIICPGPQGVRIIAGGSGWAELANVSQQQLNDFITGLAELDSSADLIIIDTGAGLANSVLSFLHASSEIIVVTTPEPTAITDAYAVIKLMSQQEDKRIHVLVNRVKNEQDARAVYSKIERTASRFLGTTPSFAGWLPEDGLVTQGIISQQPVLLQCPDSRVAKAIRQLADTLFFSAHAVEPVEVGLRSFFGRLVRFLGG